MADQKNLIELNKLNGHNLDIFLQRYIYETLRIDNKKNIFSFPFYGKTINMFLPFCSFDHIQFTILSSASFFEKEELLFVRNRYFNLDKENIVLDIGANIGNHSLFFAMYCNSKVFSFEPQENLCEIAQKNYELNSVENKIDIIRKALGAKEIGGRYGNFTSQNTGATSVLESNTAGDFSIVPLDSYCFKTIDFIKIDVEGYETELLRGAQKTLESCICPIWIEIFPENFETVNKLLNLYGYLLDNKLKYNNYIYKKTI